MATMAALQALPRDLLLDESGTIRVGRSRVTFDLVVEEYQNGATPEDVAARYSALQLPEVYSAITWYLHERETAEAYLAERNANFAMDRIAKGDSMPGVLILSPGGRISAMIFEVALFAICSEPDELEDQALHLRVP